MRWRALTPGEVALAQGMFGDALDAAPVRLWFHGRRIAFAVTLGPVITLPGPVRPDFSSEPAENRAWLLHELTHVWQMQARPLRAIASWAGVLASGGYGPGLPGYRYALPARWGRLNLEQQAAVVEDAARLHFGLPPRHGPADGRPEDYRDLMPFPPPGLREDP